MRSTAAAPDDLTARARIRDSAIVYFGRHGFRTATVRAIAADAGVSPGLVIHHFRSKEGLREACDAYVTDLMEDLTREAAEHLSAGDTLDLINRTPHLAPLVPYVMRTLNEGGEFARRLWDRLVADTEGYLRAAVAGGVAHPTGDERARAELIVMYKLGSYTFARYALPPPDGHPTDLDISAITSRYGVPALELFTIGLFRTSDYLDAFRAQQTGQTSESRQHP